MSTSSSLPATSDETTTARKTPLRTFSNESGVSIYEQTLESVIYGDRRFRCKISKNSVFPFVTKTLSRTSMSDTLDEIAPVSSKWSQASQEDDDDDIISNDGITMDDPEHSTHSICMKHLRKLVSAGGLVDDDEMSHRGVAWRILMGYLPEDVNLWKERLTEQRKLYTELAVKSFADTSDALEDSNELRGMRQRRQILEPTGLPGIRHATREIPDVLQTYWKDHDLDERILDRVIRDLNPLRLPDMDTVTNETPSSTIVQDKPLSSEASVQNDDAVDTTPTETTEPATDTASYVNQPPSLKDFAESAYLLEEIRKDVIRTHPDLSFFLEPYQNLGRRRYAALERILFLWSKYNKGVRYVQGMNEIVGILYYVLANDPNSEWAEWAEADTYWLFHSLLVEMSDVFVAGLDDHDTGIQGRIHAMQSLLARHDPEVREHLDELGIETSFYAIRWWTTLLSREFLLPDVIRLWDSMFASTHKDNFLRFACVTMVMKIRDDLLKSDFSACLRLLHSYPSVNMEDLLESSRALYIYESQVTLACHRGGLTLHQALTKIRSPSSLIMAFGFRDGTPPVTRAEQLGRAKTTVEAGVRGVFGKASKLYNQWYKTDEKMEKQQEEANDKALALGRKDDDDEILGRSRSFDSTDDIYLSAFRGS